MVSVRSAADMLGAVLEALPSHDILVMTAAVADYTPAERIEGKLKKAGGDLLLRLRRTVDILERVAAHPARGGMVVVGFSLDAEVNESEGRRKLAGKDLDGIVVNGVATFGSEVICARVLWRGGEATEVGGWGKARLAEFLLERAESLMKAR